MRTVNYQDAEKFISETKMTAFCVKSLDCATCDEWYKRFFADIEKQYSDTIDWYFVTTDESVLFPPQFSPTWYFYIPGYQEPFIRDGVLPQPEFNMGIDKLLRVKNGENPFHVFGR